MVTIIIPSRNEQFLQKTIESLLEKSRGEIEVYAVLDGYYPPANEIVNDPRVHYLHRGKARGLRNAVNSVAKIAKGEFLLKCDAHVLFDEGFDVKLAADCEKDWIVVPRRFSLDAENWCKRKSPIDYQYIECPDGSKNRDLAGKVWNERNRDPELKKILIDDLLAFQGSCWFMRKDYFFELGCFDEENYGTFRKEPQEIAFKCWLSGGRVVRNKKTWYAHLHKGKKYGRGYSLPSADWKKGDTYNGRWLTDDAWDKQTKSFRWLMEKFMPMPGWENYKWAKEKGEIKLKSLQTEPSESPSGKKPQGLRIYQNIPLEGVRHQNSNRIHSKFWNVGKWENYIAPHLPKDCSDHTFVEMGCNAGLFLKLAEDRGYSKVFGVEKDKTPVQEGLRYRDSIGYHYKMLKRTLGGQFGGNGNFSIDELPVADVTVLSTFHYYIDINSWTKYLDRLKTKSCHVLLVSRPRMKRLHWKAYSSHEALRKYFVGWEESSLKIENISQEGDPSPRNLFSIMYRSPLIERVLIKDVVVRESEDDSMYLAMKDLALEVSKNEKISPFETKYYQKWVERKKGRWTDKKIRKFVEGKFNLMRDIKENGLRDPLIINTDGKLSDGGHRLVILEALGHKSVIVRKL